jgi:hypothetical protein
VVGSNISGSRTERVRRSLQDSFERILERKSSREALRFEVVSCAAISTLGRP